MKKRKEKGRALFYTRDSGGKHENTPAEYVKWAQREAEVLNLVFDGTPDAIERMIREGRAVLGDLFLDYDVKGNILSRDGLDALTQTALTDANVSHILIPRRDRLARPDDAIDGMDLERRLRRAGVTLVFTNRVCEPLSKGRRQDKGEQIVTMLDYMEASEYRRDLAQKILFAQLRLAKSGFSTGGRPPYGFRRCLAKEDGTPVRELAEGERVRMKGHHVVWLPGPEGELGVIRRILAMLETLPASQVAKILTSEGVPTPDHGRYRTDNGVRHLTSGVWHQTTIGNIARNPLLLAMVEYGRRSMGDQLRWTPEGPRELEEADFRADDKAKVIRNPRENRITATARFEALVEPERHRQLLAELEDRGGTQRGKPRSRDPDKNPLGCRVFDMNCGWPMYRTPYSDSFRYKCGLYQQSHGASCSHNHVDGPTATRFMLSCVRQRALSPQRMQKLEKRIRQLAAADGQDNRLEQEIVRKRSEFSEVEKQLNQATQNLARAKTDEQYKAIAQVFNELSEQAKSLQAEIATGEGQLNTTSDADAAIDVAMEIIRRLPALARNVEDLATARKTFDLVNARLFLAFRPVKVKRRTLNRINGGVVTFGDAAPPIEVYQGPTARRKVKLPATSAVVRTGEGRSASPLESCIVSGREDKSLGNVSRGDWI